MTSEHEIQAKRVSLTIDDRYYKDPGVHFYDWDWDENNFSEYQTIENIEYTDADEITELFTFHNDGYELNWKSSGMEFDLVFDEGEVSIEDEYTDPFLLAIVLGNLDEVKKLLNEGADINMIDDSHGGQTPLMTALFCR